MVKLTRLRDVRERAPMTQGELAQAAKVNRVTVARIEKGEVEPYPRTIRALALALRVEPTALYD
jgi:DNA-binding XRE family transcriptional regulator